MTNNQNSQAADKAAMEELQKKLAEAEAKAKAAEEAKAAAESRAEAAEKNNAEAEAQLKALAEERETATAAKADKVKIRIPVVKNGPKDDVQVFLNGRQFIIQRGAEVEVPRGVAEILANREKMLEVIDAFDKQHAQ